MNMRDVTQGRLMILLSFITMLIFFWALFLSPQDFKLLGRTISDWALIIPILVIVCLFLIIVIWIGWAMATTPPDLPLEKQDTTD
jgi:hypothetical protein